MKKRALITGIAGMDGSHLTDLLLEKDYTIYGVIRRHSNYSSEVGNVQHLIGNPNVILEYGDVTDASSIEAAVMRSQPHEVYHLAAQSHVRISFEVPQSTLQINAMGTLNLLEALRRHTPYARMYNAATSEMFGNSLDPNAPQISVLDEKSPMSPVSPYGTSKLAAYNFCRNYRESYEMFVASGILFNHESPRRGENFVTAKIVKGACDIKHGVKDKLELGNLYAKRDWGHAKDYVRGMWMMLQHSQPDDFILATGRAHTIQEFLHITFQKLGLDESKYVTTNDAFKRPNELHTLVGNSAKARDLLGWQPSFTFEELIDDMIEAYL